MELVTDGTPRTFLVLVAHPDDENMVGPVLAKLARSGHRVHVVIATDGKYGTRTTDAAPELLGPIRRRESECAAKALGLPPPTFLSIDRLDTKNGVREYLNGRKRLLAALASELERTSPDAILTFGPDGEYGHPEHIVVGAAITELLLRDGLVDEHPLYYCAWTKDQVTDDDELSYVDARYVTHRFVYEREDELRYFDAARCFESQTTSAEVDELIRLASEDEVNTQFFRRFHVAGEATNGRADGPRSTGFGRR